VPSHMKAALVSSSRAALSSAREALCRPRTPRRTRVGGAAFVPFVVGLVGGMQPDWRFGTGHCRLRALHAGSSFKLLSFTPLSVSSSVASPNRAVNGTHNGGPQLLASATPAAPLRAPYLQR
jgi:hypothetical protein